MWIEKTGLSKQVYAVALMGGLLLAAGCSKAPEPEASAEKSAQAAVADIQSVKDMDMVHELFGPGVPDKEELRIKGSALDFKMLGADFVKEAKGAEFLVSPWFRRDVFIGADHYHVAFIQLQQLDKDTGEPVGAHVDSSAIAAITYKKTPGGWVVASRQKSPFTQAGAWGEAPKPEEGAVKYLVPSPGLSMLLVPTYYSGQGYAEEGLSLLAFDGQLWADVGNLHTGGDNSGACSDEDDAELEEDWKPCWSYTGKVAVFASSEGGKYPDMIVVHSGTKGSGAGEVGVVPNEVFSFKKGKYSNVSDK